MFEATGSLAIVQLVPMLVGLVLLPLAWALLAAFTARGGPHVGRIVAIAGSFATLCLALGLAVRLALLGSGLVLVQHVAQLARLGQLDLALDLALDPRSALFAVVIAFVGCASTLHDAWSGRASVSWRLAWSGLVVSGAMLLCVGDGLAPILAGLGALSLGAWGLARGGALGASVASLGGNVAVLLGFVFLFWSLGGAFGPEGYDSDGAPRFVLVTTGTPSADPSTATLTMTTHAGALVSSDDADLPNEPIASPFSIQVPAGVYTLRVHGGVASGDVVVPRVAFVPGRTHVLTPYGPTASLRALDDQFAVPRLAPTGRAATVRADLAARTIAGLRASAVVLLLVLGGTLAHLHALATRRGPSAIVSVLEALPAPYLAIRLAPLVEPGAADSALVLLVGAVSAVILAARACSVDDGHQALRGVLGATASAAVSAAGAADPAAALVLVSSALVGTGAALAAIDARRDLRWLSLACAGLAGVLPGAGTSPGYFLAIAAACGAMIKASAGWALFAGAIGLTLVASCTLGALAAFRVVDAVVRSSAGQPRGPSRVQGAVTVVLALAGVGAGVLLGVGTTMVGGRALHLAARLVAPAVPSPPRVVVLGSFVVALVAAWVGVALARRVSSSSAPPRWLLALGRPYAMVIWTASSVGHVTAFLHRSVRAMDRDVVDDIPAAFSQAVGRLGRLLPRKAELPGAAERFRTVVLIVMMALLGALVLSSLLLG